MTVDRFKVERIEYGYEWIDVGPGPREKGAVSDMGWLVRNYRKTYTTLEDAVKRLKELQLRMFASEYVIIISKFVDNRYVPGKVTIPRFGETLWEPVNAYEWRRMNTRFPAFHLNERRLEHLEVCIVSQWQFFKEAPLLAEILETIAAAYSDVLVDHVRSRSIFHTNIY